MLETIDNNGKAETHSFLSTPRSMMPGSWACDSPRVFIEPEQQKGSMKDDKLSIEIPHLDENNNNDAPKEAEERDAPEETARDDSAGGVAPVQVESPRSDRFECDYDKNATEIFLQLQKKEWKEAAKRSSDFPLEARTWVSRKEKHGKLRWRLLPIHAAIIFKAPENVVETLLSAYPKGAQSKDDQGMLPLHLAFRHGSSEGTVNLLLVAFPQSVDVQDRKGRIPLVLAQASASPNQEAFVRALERGPTYYANAAAATVRASVTAEQRALFDSKLIEVEKRHQQDVNELKEERQELTESVELLQKELAKQKGATQVLVDHVNSLEAQLRSKGETEKFLAVKAATLDTNLKEVNEAKDKREVDFEEELAALKSENASLQEELEKFKEDMPHKVGEERHNKERAAKHEKELKALKMDWASAQARAAVLEAQLKKKIENEHELASQVSHLAKQLAESAAESGNSASMYIKRVQVLEEEREKLRATVNELGKKLMKVSQFMNKMTMKTQENAKKGSQEAKLKEAKLRADAANHESLIRSALEERKHMAELLKKQELEMERSAKQHQEILEKLAELKNAPTDDSDEEEVPFSNSLTEEMQEMMDNVFMGVDGCSSEDSDMVNSIMASTPSGGKKAAKGIKPGMTLAQLLEASSSDTDEDPQKCLEEALRALELSRTKSNADTPFKSMSEVSSDDDEDDEGDEVYEGAPSVNHNPSDEESGFKRVQQEES